MKELFLHLLATLAGVSKNFWALLEPVLKDSAQSFLDKATADAVPIVTDLEKLTLPSAYKRTQAVNKLVADFKSEGKTLGLSIANLAVELALQKLRAPAAS